MCVFVCVRLCLTPVGFLDRLSICIPLLSDLFLTSHCLSGSICLIYRWMKQHIPLELLPVSVIYIAGGNQNIFLFSSNIHFCSYSPSILNSHCRCIITHHNLDGKLSTFIYKWCWSGGSNIKVIIVLDYEINLKLKKVELYWKRNWKTKD